MGSIISGVAFLLRERSLKPYFDYKNRTKKISEFLDCDINDAESMLIELDASKFLQELTEKLSPYSKIQTGSMLSPLRAPVLYMLIRLLKPSIVVETGVASGVSTSIILKAMSMNKTGKLYSIDLPASPENDPIVRLPPGKSPGWILPDELKSMWTFLPGKSSDVLPHLLPKLQKIDVFIHDSLHTYENMLYEYRASWPYIKSGGILMSDDITWNNAFPEFIQEAKPKKVTEFYAFGMIMKQ